MERLYLDDLSVGQRFTSGTHTMTTQEILDFASHFDPQPFHLDDDAGRATLFGGLVASGWHTAAVSMRLNVDGGLPIAGGIIGSGGELRWTKPVRPGDVLHVEYEILEITPSRTNPGRGTVVVRCLTMNQDGEMVQSFTPKLLVPRRPGT